MKQVAVLRHAANHVVTICTMKIELTSILELQEGTATDLIVNVARVDPIVANAVSALMRIEMLL